MVKSTFSVHRKSPDRRTNLTKFSFVRRRYSWCWSQCLVLTKSLLICYKLSKENNYKVGKMTAHSTYISVKWRKQLHISSSSSQERHRSERHPLKFEAEIGKKISELCVKIAFLSKSVVILCCQCIVLPHFSPNHWHFRRFLTTQAPCFECGIPEVLGRLAREI